MGSFRFILALSVLLIHSNYFFGYYILPGNVAVESFFIISGFYMSLILNEKYLLITKGYKLFLTNRLLRIFPLYWSVLLISLIISLLLFLKTSAYNFKFFNEHFNDLTPLAAAYIILTNIFIIGQDVLFFLKQTLNGLKFTAHPADEKVNVFLFILVTPAWTLSLEIMFYFISPIFIKAKTIITLVIIIVIFATRCIASRYGLDYEPWLYRFFPFELMWFLLGTLSYKIYKYIALIVSKNVQRAVFLTLLLFTFIFSSLVKNSLIVYVYLFFVALTIPFVFALFKSSKTDRLIGEFSFPLYLTHYQMIPLGQYLSTKFRIDHIYLSIVVFLLSLTISYVLLITLGQRIEKYRNLRFKLGNT